MRTQSELLAAAQHALLPNYRPPPLVLTEGRGSWVRDVEGNEYLDFSGGIAVLSLGHAHPHLAKAISEQAHRLIHTSNLFYNDRAIELASRLVAKTPFDRVYFANSGTEANEALIKLARRWHHEHGSPERVELVAALHSFHGRTMGALTLTGQPKYHVGLKPLLPGVHHVPYDDLAALDGAITERTAAVILEPLQGEGGLVTPSPGYLARAKELAHARGALFFYDEVQTGYGRTGRFLAHEHEQVVPDACSLAKGMGGGFPIGSILVSERLADGLPPGSHASTFGGNPLACAAGLAVLDVIEQEGLVEHAARMGEHLHRGLTALAQDPSLPAAAEARGLGLLAGVRLADGVDANVVLTRLRIDEGLLASIAGGTVIRFAPPLNVKVEDLDDALERLAGVLRGIDLPEPAAREASA